jgi:predicted esterase
MPDAKRFPIESLLSARRLVSPQLCGERIYFLSDMSGLISLYAMNKEGSIPEPLLPSGLALQNPHLMDGRVFYALPKLQKILVMIDENGNENYQPSFVPVDGGIPEPIFGDRYKGEKLACLHCDVEQNVAYFYRDDRKTPNIECLQTNLQTLETNSLGKSIYGNTFNGANKDHSMVILTDGYTAQDNVLFIWRRGVKERELLYGTPIDKREPGQEVKFSGIGTCHFTDNDRGLLFRTTLFHDEAGLGYLRLDNPSSVVETPISGLKHEGQGELVETRHVHEDRYVLEYNIDGCSWLYEGRFFVKGRAHFDVDQVVCGIPPLSDGVALEYEFELNRSRREPFAEYVLSFTKATSPSQLYLFNPHNSSKKEKQYSLLSSERILGIEQKLLSEGEDKSYTSFDGIRISARLYMPSEHLGFAGPRPLVLYVHGGPQGQERPDFTWFSMPLIQYLTLNGFAVFVPNVRGSTGYGLRYMKMVDHDWGGKDRLDQIEGIKMLEKDPRIDSSRRAVIGRSYGGYMTLTLVSRHPGLWKAACDMFGPYDLPAFINRLPESWKTFFYLSLGHPEKDHGFLIERSPRTYMDSVSCPMLIIQGKNDPRVLKEESAEIAEKLKARGLDVEFLLFEDEGHDVLKYKNRVTCYTKIRDFFQRNLVS